MINLLKANARHIVVLFAAMLASIMAELFFLSSLRETLKNLSDITGLYLLIGTFLLKIILQLFLAYQQPRTAFLLLESISKNVLLKILDSKKIETLPDTIRFSTIESDHVVMGLILPLIVFVVEVCMLAAVAYYLLRDVDFFAISILASVITLIFFLFIFISKYQHRLGGARLVNDRDRIKAIRNLHVLNHELKYVGNREWFIRDFQSKLHNVIASAKISNFLQQIPRQIIEISGLFLIILLYVHLNSSGISMQEMVAFFGVLIAGALRVIPSVTKILSSMQSIIYTRPSYRKIDEILSNNLIGDKSILSNCIVKDATEEIIAEYSISQAGGAVNKRRYKIKKKSLNIIVGESGVGKTTLLHALCDAAFCAGMSTKKGGGNFVSLLTQESSVIEGSFLDNIFLHDAVTREEIISSQYFSELLNLLKLKDISNRFDSDNFIQENGANISGGEARRICLARHLLKKPAILFLDEPTSGLNHEAEYEIFKLLKILSANLTVVVVTHSIIASDFADFIIQLRNEK